MNPGLRAVFESVRDVMAGRVDDEVHVREVALRLADESVVLRRRIEVAAGYARRGLRLEACWEAESDPALHPLAVALCSDEMRRWDQFCSARGLPRPEFPSEEAIKEIDEAIEQMGRLRGRLSLMRRLVLSDASAWVKLEVLRDLIARDPENSVWAADRDELELVAAAELNARIDQDILLGDLRHAETCCARLGDGKWSQPIAARLASQCRRRLGAAKAERATVDAAALVQQIEAEWAAENVPAAREALRSWDSLARRIAECGGTMPGELSARAAAAAAWLSDREAHADARRLNADLVEALDRAARDGRTGLDELHGRLHAAEQGVDGVPEAVRAVAEGRIAELERSRAIGRAFRVSVAVAAILGITVLAYWWIGSSKERAEAGRRMQAAAEMLDELESASARDDSRDRLRALSRALEDLASDESTRNHADLRGLQRRHDELRESIVSSGERLRELLERAGDPTLPGSRDDWLSEADRLKERVDPEQWKQVDDWRDRHERARQESRRSTDMELLRRVKSLQESIEGGESVAGSDIDRQLRDWRHQLELLRREATHLQGARLSLEICDAALRNLEKRVNDSQRRQAQLDLMRSLPSLASRPLELSAALRSFAEAHPAAEQSVEFHGAAANGKRWAALLDWPGIEVAPDAKMPQQGLEDLAASLASYLDKHPDSPLAARVEALAGLLRPTANWRGWLRSPAASKDCFMWWVVRYRDDKGARKELTTAGQPEQQAIRGQACWWVRRVDTNEFVAVPVDGATVDRVPEHELISRLGSLQELRQRSNNAADALAAVRMIVDAAESSPIERVRIVDALLESAVADMPGPIEAAMSEARKRMPSLPRGRDCSPGDPVSADRARRWIASLETESWQANWEAALRTAWQPLRDRYEAVGIVLRPDSAQSGMAIKGLPGGESLFAVVEDGRFVEVGSVGPLGDFVPQSGIKSDSLPQGSPLFVRKASKR